MSTPVQPARAPEADSLSALRKDVAGATSVLKHSAEVPPEIHVFVHELGRHIDADTASMVDPYLAKELWRFAYEAVNALQIDGAKAQRIELRMALEQLLDVLDELADVAPVGPAVPIQEVLERTAALVSAPQDKFAELLGVSTRTLQRWLSGQGNPDPDDADRARTVAQLINQLSHTFTRAGIVAWFHREHPQLGLRRPIDLLADPLSYPELLSVATSARSMPI